MPTFAELNVNFDQWDLQGGSSARCRSLLQRVPEGPTVSATAAFSPTAAHHHVRLGCAGVRLPVNPLDERSVDSRLRPACATLAI